MTGVLQLVSPTGIVEEVRCGRRDVDVTRLLDRLAVVDRLEYGDFAGAFLDDPRDPKEKLASLGTGQSSPFALSCSGGLDRAVNIDLGGLRDFAQHFFGGRTYRLESTP